METIVIATQLPHLSQAAGHLTGVEFTRTTLETVISEARSSMLQLLFADADSYAELDDVGRRKLSGFLKILLITPDMDRDAVLPLRRASTHLFCLSDRERITDNEAENLVSLVRSLFAQQQMAMRLNSYISDSFQTIIDAQIVERQKAEIEKLNEELHSISRVDYLTSLLNRRAFLESLEAETKRAQRNQWRLSSAAGQELPQINTTAGTDFSEHPRGDLTEHIGKLSCMIIDIDFFKQVNDTYGHLAGDMVLRKLGCVLREDGLFRENDIIGRYGGEEFILVLPETGAKHARIPAERLRERIKALRFSDDNQNDFSITLSIGIAESMVGQEDTDSLIRRADTALYYAKEHGRDRVCVFEEDLPANSNAANSDASDTADT